MVWSNLIKLLRVQEDVNVNIQLLFSLWFQDPMKRDFNAPLNVFKIGTMEEPSCRVISVPNIINRPQRSTNRKNNNNNKILVAERERKE